MIGAMALGFAEPLVLVGLLTLPVLWWLLRRRGIAAELRIGARKEFDRFEAHAWVEADSAVLNDATAEHRHFVPFDGPITPLEARID